jgi:hypothetical protein
MMTRLHSSAFSLLSDFGRENGAGERPDHEAELKAAFNEGYRQGQADGRAEAESDGELRIAETKALCSEQNNEERQIWQRDCADVLGARFDGVANLIERSIEGRIAPLLRPWLTDRLRERALQDLEKAISRALVDGAKVHIEAPAEIIHRLRERLPTEAFQIGYSENSNSDIRAHVEDTEIEANISAWITELEATVR